MRHQPGACSKAETGRKEPPGDEAAQGNTAQKPAERAQEPAERA
jgi:hypothetical protein